MNYLQPTLTSINKPNFITFKGQHSLSKNERATNVILVFDVDGSVANGTAEDLKEFKKVVSSIRNNKLVYATGQNLNTFLKEKGESSDKGIDILSPDYLITSNGVNIYKQQNNKYMLDTRWNEHIQNLNFNPEKIKNVVQEVGNFMGGYCAKNDSGKQSKFVIMESPRDEGHYSQQYLVAKHKKNSLILAIKNSKQIGTNFEIVTDYIEPQLIKPLPEQYKKSLAPVMDNKGGIHTIHILPVNKAQAVSYLANELKLKISPKSVITAGNGENDISLLEKFTFILLNNAQEGLKKIAAKGKNVFRADNNGTNGITEGLKLFIQKFKLK